MEIFQNGMRFWKGNLHCHTTLSDGEKTPEQAIEIYRAMGYDFLAITDHRGVTVPQSRMAGSMLLVPGIELDYMLPGEVVHIVGFGMTEPLLPLLDYEQGPQKGIDVIRACGGRAIVAHPHWSLNTPDTLMALHGALAAEVYNTMSYPRQDSACLLDLAAVRGRLYPLVASDDTHEYSGEQGVGFTVVQAESLTAEAIKAAMDQGRFYASQGPRIEQLTLADGKLIVQCSPAIGVYFSSNLAWAPGQRALGEGITQAVYPLNLEMGERYVRCQVVDAQGKSAWSSPIAL